MHKAGSKQGPEQGCQIFIGLKYQNGEKYTRLPQNIPNGHKIFPIAVKYVDQMVIKYTKIFHSKIYPNWDFWFENLPSGNPGPEIGENTTINLKEIHNVHRVTVSRSLNQFWPNLEPILRHPNLQLQRRRCSRLERFL
jgi:hypothetical protein